MQASSRNIHAFPRHLYRIQERDRFHNKPSSWSLLAAAVILTVIKRLTRNDPHGYKLHLFVAATLQTECQLQTEAHFLEQQTSGTTNIKQARKRYTIIIILTKILQDDAKQYHRGERATNRSNNKSHTAFVQNDQHCQSTSKREKQNTGTQVQRFTRKRPPPPGPPKQKDPRLDPRPPCWAGVTKAAWKSSSDHSHTQQPYPNLAISLHHGIEGKRNRFAQGRNQCPGCGYSAPETRGMYAGSGGDGRHTQMQPSLDYFTSRKEWNTCSSGEKQQLMQLSPRHRRRRYTLCNGPGENSWKIRRFSSKATTTTTNEHMAFLAQYATHSPA